MWCTARAVYGNELCSDSMYYASYNEDGKERCHKDLTTRMQRKTGWVVGDVVTVRVDLEKFKIKFLLNGDNVRKSISLQRGREYYPFVSYVGKCEYQLINFE